MSKFKPIGRLLGIDSGNGVSAAQNRYYNSLQKQLQQRTKQKTAQQSRLNAQRALAAGGSGRGRLIYNDDTQTNTNIGGL